MKIEIRQNCNLLVIIDHLFQISFQFQKYSMMLMKERFCYFFPVGISYERSQFIQQVGFRDDNAHDNGI